MRKVKTTIISFLRVVEKRKGDPQFSSNLNCYRSAILISLKFEPRIL